jgi:hypothetical protein
MGGAWERREIIQNFSRKTWEEHCASLRMDGRMKKLGVKVWTGFSWLWTGTGGEIL